MSIYIDRHIGCGGEREGKGDRHYEPNEGRERERFGIGILLRRFCSGYEYVQYKYIQAQVSDLFYITGWKWAFLGLYVNVNVYVYVYQKTKVQSSRRDGWEWIRVIIKQKEKERKRNKKLNI